MLLDSPPRPQKRTGAKGLGRALTYYVGLCLHLLALSCTTSTPTTRQPKAEPEVDVKSVEARIQPHPRLPPRSYTDGMGTVLEFVPVKIRDVSDVVAIVRMSGVPKSVDSLPILATREVLRSGRHEWTIRMDGSARVMVNVKKDATGTNVSLMLPHPRGRVKVVHDTASSESIDAKELIRDYERALASGVLEVFEKVDRAARIEHGEKSINAYSEQVADSCGAAIPVEVSWEELTDTELGRQYYCHNALERIHSLCKRDENTKSDILSTVKKISCRKNPGEKPELSITKEGVLTVLRPRDYDRGISTRAADWTSILNLKPTVLQGKPGFYLTISPERGRYHSVHAGWAPLLHKQSVTGSSDVQRMELWQGASQVSLRNKEGRAWQASCPSGPLTLKEVSREERDRLLATVKLGPRVWQREEMALARDRVGTYFYVDRLIKRDGGRGYRLFRGPRGAVKLVGLLDVVSDPGVVMLVMSGARLQIRHGATLVKDVVLLKKKRSETLQNLSLLMSDNLNLVYSDLGAYDGQTFGGVCDQSRAGRP